MPDMEKRKTIKDIAQELGVSTATVHRALYGKKGVGSERQTQILELCEKYGYQINGAASALKRGLIRIAAVLPSELGPSRYYYENVWKGVKRGLAEQQNYNVELRKITYDSNSRRSQEEALRSIDLDNDELPDGILTIGYNDSNCSQILRQFSMRGVPVFLTCDDDEVCGRIACAQANYIATGKMVAELLASQLPKYSTVLLLAGDETIPSHINIIRGFEEYMDENHILLHIRKMFGYYDEASLYRELINTLETCNDITGIFSVSARLSVVLLKAIEEKHLNGRIRIVASDLFKDTKTALANGMIQSIIFKDPEQQAYLAVKMMMDYILRAIKPENPVNYVESKLVLHSSLPFYE